MKRMLLLTLLPVLALAQSFRYEAQVKPVRQSGYYRLVLSPDVLGRLNDGLGDLRVYSGQRVVPYLLLRQDSRQANVFQPFAIASQTNVPKANTTLVIKRPNRQPIRSLYLEIKNAVGLKSAQLSGSPDGQHWFLVDQAVTLGRQANTQQVSRTSYGETISFPTTDYLFFRLQISDSTSAPLNILKAGTYGQIMTEARYAPVTNLHFRQLDSSDHSTYLFVDRPTPARLDQLTIQVASPVLFRRRASVGYVVNQTVGGKRNRRRINHSFNTIAAVDLSSTSTNTVQLSRVLTDRLCIRIANDDDPPLRIGSLTAAQLTTYLVARLQADSTYTLRFGDPQTAPPVYDLTYFQDTLSGLSGANTLPLVAVGPVVGHAEALDHKKPRLSTTVLWLSIGGVLLLLGYMSYQMLNRLPTRNADSTKPGDA